jgi:hypothetical protein
MSLFMFGFTDSETDILGSESINACDESTSERNRRAQRIDTEAEDVSTRMRDQI